MATKHIESWLGEAVVHIAVIGDVDAHVPGVVTEFEVKPKASDIASTLVGDHRTESEQRSSERGLDTDREVQRCRRTGWRDFNARCFGTIILDHWRNGRDRVGEFAAFLYRAVSIEQEVR